MTAMTATDGAPASVRYQPSIHLIVAAIGLVLALGYTAIQLMTVGHASFNTTNLGIVWGLPIVMYDYFLLTSTGLTLVASLSLVLGLREFDLIAKRCIWLAISGLVGGVAVLFLNWAIRSARSMRLRSPCRWPRRCSGKFFSSPRTRSSLCFLRCA